MGHKVLLADDSITVQKIVKLSLTEEGIEVIAVGNGEQAVQQLETLRPDLVLADVFMPGKDGYEVCEFVKAQPHLKNTPVILLVHAFEPFDPDRAKKVGADHQLTKPFQSIRTLVTTVQELLASAGAPHVMNVSSETANTVSMHVTPAVNVPSVTLEGDEVPFGHTVTDSFASTAKPVPLMDQTVHSIPIETIPTTNTFPIPEESLPVPLTGQNIIPKSDLLPPSELAVLTTPDWTTPSPVQNTWQEPLAAPLDANSQPLAASFQPLTLSTQFIAQDNSSEDVLELSDVLPDTSGVPLHATITPISTQFPADVPLLAVRGNAVEPEETASISIDENHNTFATSFDVAAGHISSPLEIHESASTNASQDIDQGTVGASAHTSSLVIPEAVIEDIVNRVVHRLSTKAIQEIAWEVVPEMAELLIRKQISQSNQIVH